MESITIDNQSLVTEKLGHWPSFHDAEIEGVFLKRNRQVGWPIISLWIILRVPTSVSTSIANTHNLWRMELKFTEVTANEFEGFKHQNVIFDLSFQQDNGLVICSIDTSYGMSGSITARHIAVNSLVLIETD